MSSQIDKKILCVLSKVNGCPTLSQTLKAMTIVDEITESFILDILSPSSAVAYGKLYISRALKELADIASFSPTGCKNIVPLVDKLFYTFDEVPQSFSGKIKAAMPGNEKTNLPHQFFHRETPYLKEQENNNTTKTLKEKTLRPLPEIPHPRKTTGSQKSKMIIQEVIDTERRYVKGLEDLIKVYKAPMECIAALSTKDIDSIFSTIPSMYSLHKDFLDDLEKEEGRSLAQKFVDYMPQMKNYYIKYGNNFNRALRVVNNLKKTVPEFVEFVQTQSKAHFGASAYDCLGSLLITPIQRLPRYKLLLTELSKQDNYKDPALSEAEKILSEIVEAVNDNIEKGKEDTKTLSSEICAVGAPGRKLVRRGDLTLKDWKGVSKQNIHALLFVDTLLLTRKKKFSGQLIVLLSEPLRNCRRVEELPCLSLPQMLNDKGSQIGFGLTTVRGSITFDAKTEEERDEWVSDLRRLIINARMSFLHAKKATISFDTM